jgi:hypothetical protein
VEILRASKNTSSAIMNTAQSASGMNQYMVRYFFHNPLLHCLLHNIFHHILRYLLHHLLHHLVLHPLLHYLLFCLLHYLFHYLLHHLNYLFHLRRNVALLYFTTL